MAVRQRGTRALLSISLETHVVLFVRPGYGANLPATKMVGIKELLEDAVRKMVSYTARASSCWRGLMLGLRCSSRLMGHYTFSFPPIQAPITGPIVC